MNYKETKQWLKDSAINIRETKFEFKNSQREGHWRKSWELQEFLSGLRREYRHRHIAYSLCRGRTREQIERPAENNKPDEFLIEGYINEIRAETVCSSSG